jgi:KH/beta-lactamase-domain protein
MQRKDSYDEITSQQIMAAILQNLPEESGLTKIEYEGPRIALYSRNPTYLMQNTQLLSNIVNKIKKRLVVRVEESIRKAEHEVTHILHEYIPKETEIVETFFDPALGEATIFVKKPSLLTYAGKDFSNIELIEKTGWNVMIRKAPLIMDVVRDINEILHSTVNQRIRFYREVGEKIYRSKLNEIAEASLITLGGFAEVGRSCMLLTTHESKILLDCGINEAANSSLYAFPRFDITGIEMDQIDGVILTHAHLDHSGFLPTLFKHGYQGPVYCSEPTLPIMKLLQKQYIKNNDKITSFSLQDIDDVIMHTIPISFGMVTDISPDIRLVFTNSGHMIGSASIHLHIGNGDHNLVYTGDLKFSKTLSLENASWNFPRAETIIIESTHGGKEDIFPQREQAETRFINSINSTINEKGKVLIPVPAAGLSQEILLLIDMYIKAGKIVESKVLVEKIISEVNSIYEVYPEYLSKELMTQIIEKDSPFASSYFEVIESATLGYESAIILAPSSMLIGGPSVEYLKQISDDPNNKLILTCYQGIDTPGRHIQNGNRQIIINNKSINIDCQIEKIEGLSSHSDYNQLIAYVNRLRAKLKRVLVNHGERVNVQNLATSINRMFKIQTQHPLVQEAIKLL